MKRPREPRTDWSRFGATAEAQPPKTQRNEARPQRTWAEMTEEQRNECRDRWFRRPKGGET